MAKIVDPDQLNQATEVVFSTVAKTYQLLVAGNLDDNSPGKSSGVTMQAFYSFCKEEWLTDSALNKFRFPIDPIFDAQYNITGGWSPADAQTRDLKRDGGWREVNGDEYACIISLGDMDAPLVDQAYYQNTTGFDQTTTTFDKTGELNEGILIYDASGPTDYRDFLKVYLREQGKTYSEGNLLVDQGLSTLTYVAYRVPLSNGPDPNITQSDAFIDANAPYTGMSINFLQGSGFTTWANSTVYAAGAVVLDPTRQSGGSSNGTWWFTLAGGTSSGTGTADDVGVTWESYSGEEQIGSEWFAFNVVVLANGGTKEEVHEFCQRELRRTTNINDDGVGSPNQDGYGVVNGNVSKTLTFFEGDLITQPGVLIRNFDSNDTNAIQLTDITVDGGGLDSEDSPVTGTRRTFPFVAAGSIVFSSNLVLETNANTQYKMYFERTRRQTGTDVAMTAVSANAGTLTSSSTDLSAFSSGDYLVISGFANGVNNGTFRVTGATTTTTAPVEKPYNTGDVLVLESAGPTVNLDHDPFDTPDAIIVDDDSATDISGQVSTGTVSFTFDYDGNVQGGRAAGTDAPVVIYAQGLADSKWVEASFTITRQVGLSFPVNAGNELVYSNP